MLVFIICLFNRVLQMKWCSEVGFNVISVPCIKRLITLRGRHDTGWWGRRKSETEVWWIQHCMSQLSTEIPQSQTLLSLEDHESVFIHRSALVSPSSSACSFVTCCSFRWCNGGANTFWFLLGKPVIFTLFLWTQIKRAQIWSEVGATYGSRQQKKRNYMIGITGVHKFCKCSWDGKNWIF